MRSDALWIGVIALGVLLLLAAPGFMDLGYDANTYVATGHGFAQSGELVLQWGDVLTFAPAPPGHSHHFPPAYPLYLGVVFLVFGYGLAQAKLAGVFASLAALGVMYLCTRDLYGHRRALLGTALLAVAPWAFWITGMGFSEGLATLLFTLTMWAILKSLDDERYIALAGAFAALAYLARSSMGAFFVIAGGAGFAWRLAHRGWRATLSSPWYALAILTFALIVGAWAYRNVELFGWPNWETSPGTRYIPQWIAAHPREYALGLLVRAPLLLAPLAPMLALLWPEARRSVRRIRDEHTSGLWLSVLLVWVLGLVFSAAYFSMGPSRYEVFRLDNLRYAVVGVVPLTWALVREVDLDARPTQRRILALLAVSLAGCLLVATFPAQSLPAQAARSLDEHLREGDVIAVAGSGKYPFYAYLSEPAIVSVYTWGNAGPDERPEFVVSVWTLGLEGYKVAAHETQTHWWWPADDDQVIVYIREDVAQARNITRLAPLRAGW